MGSLHGAVTAVGTTLVNTATGQQQLADQQHEVPGQDGKVAALQVHRRDEVFHSRAPEGRPADTCPRQEKQPVDGKGKMCADLRKDDLRTRKNPANACDVFQNCYILYKFY